MPGTSKAILITGCSTGIGRATAERLARAGHTVYATARNEATLEPLRELGARTLALDVCDEESMRAGVERVVAEQGAVGVLVNNAGYSQDGAIESVSMDAVQRQFQTNVFGLIRMCQLVLPGMRAQRYGRIVNISSMGANFTFPGAGLYHATKYAVEAISDALRFEVKDFGVGVTVIQPGLIRTNFGEAAAHSLEGQASERRGAGRGVRALQPGRRENDRRGLPQGPARAVRGRARRGRKGDREGDHPRQCADSRPRHPLRADADRAAADDGSGDVGPVPGDAVHAARSRLIRRVQPGAISSHAPPCEPPRPPARAGSCLGVPRDVPEHDPGCTRSSSRCCVSARACSSIA